MDAKNFSEASFFIEVGQTPGINVHSHPYEDAKGKGTMNADIEIESSDKSEFILKLSLPIPALKALIAAAQEFLDEPGPDPRD